MQRLMLIHSLTSSGNSSLSNQFRYRLTGDLDVPRFLAAIERIFSRHDVLRTCFLWEGLSNPVQVVRRKVTLPVEVKDLRGLSDVDRQRELREIEHVDRRRLYDLRKAPLMRFVLVQVADSEYRIVWNRHHLILDRWSASLFFEELFHNYAHRDVTGSGNVAKPGSFQEYVRWIASQDNNRAFEYWRAQLDGFSAPSCLVPNGNARSSWTLAGLPGVSRSLPGSLERDLLSLATNCGVTMATVIQAAVALVIAQRARVDDVVFGMTVSGRPAAIPDIEQTMGSFISNVPVRVALDKKITLRSFLSGIQSAQGERTEFEYLSPADIYRATALNFDKPLFDLILLFGSPESEVLRGAHFDIEQLPSPIDSAYPFTLTVARAADEFRASAAYDPAYMSEGDAQDVISALQDALCRIAGSKDERLGAVFDIQADTSASKTVGHVLDQSDFAAGAGSIPLDSHVAVLTDIWAKTLGLPRVGLDEDFFALGGTSIQAAIAFAKMEQQLGRKLPLSTLINATSIRELLHVLEMPAPPATSLVEVQPHGSRPQLFGIEGIDGNVVSLAYLARLLGRDQPLFGLQPVALSTGGKPLTRIEDIAARYIEDINSVRNGPIVLFGVCFGAAVALEISHQLMAAGHPPALLITLDLSFPQPSSSSAFRHSQQMVVARLLAERIRLYREQFAGMDADQRRDWFKGKRDQLVNLIRKRDTSAGNRMEIRQRRVTSAHLEALHRYRPQPWSGRSAVLISADRTLDDRKALEHEWRKYLPDESPMHHVRGSDTGDAMSARNVSQVAGILADEIGHIATPRIEPATQDL